ncbi:hypothetical protein BUALT_Bualt06G0130500 [Buddleja alternifolia]|uniref:Protein kinase domain-containing protein n=1 Tax=Buddleja alternifolia TaxID=168488 RepID=A0AAV6XLL8_9LAMI|nr:hypothetical protein BUALT_Bualt06G0130500 [Buddleja alternifolia]
MRLAMVVPYIEFNSNAAINFRQSHRSSCFPVALSDCFRNNGELMKYIPRFNNSRLQVVSLTTLRLITKQSPFSGKMSRIYDNWERLVVAVLRKQQLWQLFHEQSRSPSILSEESDFGSISFRDDSLSLGSPSTCWKQVEKVVAESQNLIPKLVFISDFSPAFDAEDLFLASAEFLGRGTFGSVHTAVMDNGVRIVVRRLNSVSISEEKFNRHMDIISNVRHENVAPLRAYYSSSSDEKLMLYDYYSDRSVYDLLHGQKGKDLAHVDWETRLRIAVGAARGIAEIHSRNGGKLVHGNIKSSNIFLNPQRYGCVSDLGVANMIATTFMPTAWCIAPEVENTQNVSQASDVYSFGILLLELLTRKSPVHVPGGPEAVNLVKLVSSVRSKDRTAKVFDADLLKDSTIRDFMVKVLQIGISCIAKSIEKRPKMAEVVNMFDDLNKIDRGNSVPFEGKLIFVEDGNPTFELEDMLRASAQILGKGTFGTSYKAMFQNGETTIMVKRLKDVNVRFQDFQQHMEVIGRMRHKNVARLKAYHYARNKALLVYDYYYQESVSALLHRKRGTEKIPLSWETRLKIAVGAARGIAYIHRQDGQTLLHGNIKSSNIFLNEQQYGLVSDAGLQKVMNPIRQSVRRYRGYCAPEGEMSQASDVYSFGVVLLELVSGRPPHRTTEDGEVISLVEWVQSAIRDEWTAGVFDLELLMYRKEEKAMVQLLQIAIDCVNFVPGYRPKMNEVVKMLEKISGVNAGHDSELFMEIRLENLLENLLPIMIVHEWQWQNWENLVF